jgi:hypothetical protein
VLTRGSASLLSLFLLSLGAGPAAADPIGPDCDTCQGAIYTLLYDPTPVGTVGDDTIWEITLRIDTTGYDGGGASIGDVGFKVSSSLEDASVMDAPGGAGDWTAFLDNINANGCQADGPSGFACARSDDDSNATLPFAGVYEWVFHVSVDDGDELFLDPFEASVKVRYLDDEGEKIGDLVSEGITLQVIPEPGTLLLIGAGIAALAAKRRS